MLVCDSYAQTKKMLWKLKSERQMCSWNYEMNFGFITYLTHFT